MSDELSQILNYQFRDPSLLKVALTHRSKGGEHNERLEFLGDAVVNFVIAEILYHQFPKATEFELGRYLLLGQGEMRSGGHERQSILSCAMEALIGAVYLDGGFEMACTKI